MIDTSPNRRKTSAAWMAVLVLGVVLRIAIVALPGNQLRAPWSGGGDAPNYVLLAQNLIDGRGFTYASQPTALRAPGYPVMLAGLMWLFGDRYILAIRWIQFFLGLGTVYFCSRASAEAFGEKAGRATLVIGLFFPTLIYITGEVLTECVGAFLASLFLYLLVKQIRAPRMQILAEMGLLIGLAALFRFNMAALLFIGLWVAFRVTNSQPAWLRCLVLAACAGIAVSPWLIRNQIVFHGRVLYSTLSGRDSVEGVITVQGRALPGDTEKMEAAEGWNLPDIETNNPSRMRFASEAELNRKSWGIARELWSQWGWRLLPLAVVKCSYFWLSTDQIFWTQSFSLHERLVRWGGVIVYWLFLGLGIAGWSRTRRSNPMLAHAFLLYAVLLTLLHLPFPMITRLRVPFMDPLITILAGGACWR